MSLLTLSKPNTTEIVQNCILHDCYSIAELASKISFDDYVKMFKGRTNDVNGNIMQGINLAQTYLVKIQSENRFLWAMSYKKLDVPQIKIFDAIFDINNIDKTKFVFDVLSILNMAHPKINTLVINGPPNGAKTLILSLLANMFIHARISIQNSTGAFYFQPLLGQSVIFADELWVLPNTVDSWKMIMGGQSVDVDCKNNTFQRLERTPVFVAHNHVKLGRGWLNSIDEEALSRRCIKYTMGHDVTSLITCNLDKEAFSYWMYLQIKDEV